MKRILTFTLLAWLMAAQAWAAITFDAASSAQGTTSATWDATIAADANIAIVCLAEREDTGSVTTGATVTVGGASATLLVAKNNNGVVVRSNLFYKLAPATGTVQIVATGGTGTDNVVAGIMTFKGVAQTSTFNTTPTATEDISTNADIASVASAVGEMGVLCGAARYGAADIGASADATAPVSTERFDRINTTNVTGFGYTEDGAVTSIAMRVDLSESVQWAVTAVSMKPAIARPAQQPIFFP